MALHTQHEDSQAEDAPQCLRSTLGTSRSSQPFPVQEPDISQSSWLECSSVPQLFCRMGHKQLLENKGRERMHRSCSAATAALEVYTAAAPHRAAVSVLTATARTGLGGHRVSLPAPNSLENLTESQILPTPLSLVPLQTPQGRCHPYLPMLFDHQAMRTHPA